MPQIFKALATIAVWACWVSSWVAGLLTFIFGGIIHGYAFGAGPVPASYPAGYAVCIGFGFAAGFMMLVRKKLEQ